MSEPRIIEAGLAVDDRGSLTFANAFDFAGVKRFYKVTNHTTEVIRAWHGHLKEGKYVYVARGAAILGAVKLDDVKNPSREAKVLRWVLSDQKPSLVFVPPGYANGFRTLVPDTHILFFSTSSLDESKGDDYRFPADYWGAQVWQVENR
jgi:dTDP-4-dehydrorhamnose 3,5-epimerase-like enzyme